MAENLKIEVDYKVARAIAEGKQFAATLDDTARKIEATEQALDDMEKSLDAAAQAEQKAAADAAKAGQAMADMGGKARQAAADVDKAGGAVSTMGKAVADATIAAGAAAESAAGHALNWVKGYLGLHGVLALIHQINEASRQQVEFQKTLVEGKLGQDELLRMVQRNLQLQGVQGQSRARSIVEGFQNQTNMTFEQSAALVGSAQATGFDPLGKVGRESTIQLGRFGGSENLNSGEIESMARLIAQKGIADNPKEIQNFLGTIQRAFTATGTTDMGAFVRAVSSTLGQARQKGLPENEALSMLSGFVTTEHSADFAADRMRMVMQMGEGAQPKVTAFLAQHAKQMGLINTKNVTMEDVERMAAGGDEDKKGHLDALRHEKLKLDKAERELADATTDRGEFERTPAFRHLRSAEARDRALREADERVADKRTARDTIAGDRVRMEKRVLEETQADVNRAAFMSLPLSKTIPIFTQAYAGGIGDAETRRQVAIELGGRPEKAAAVAATAQPGYIRARDAAMNVISQPNPAQAFHEAYEGFAQINVGERTRSKGAQQQQNAAETDPGMEFADMVAGESSSDFIRYGKEKGAVDLATDGGGVNLSKDAQQAAALQFRAGNYLTQLWGMLTHGERVQYRDRFNEIYDQIANFGGGFLGSSRVAGLWRALRALGNVRSEILANRRKSGNKADFSGIAVPGYKGEAFPFKLNGFAPRANSFGESIVPDDALGGDGGGGGGATTQPAGPVGGGHSSIQYNIQVGNWFSGDGGAPDVPGRLEGIG